MERRAETAETTELRDLLTQREIEVVQLTADGLTEEEIGLALNLSAKTIKSHRNNIGNKGDVEEGSRKTVAKFIIDGIGKGWISHSIGEDEAIEPLTPREFDVALLYVFGNSRNEIASKLTISIPNVRNLITEVRNKLSAKSSSYGTIARIAYLFANGMLKRQ